MNYLKLPLMIALFSMASMVAVAGEPFLQTEPNELTGNVQIGNRLFAAKLVDRDQNGAFSDSGDRLFLDLDSNGKFHSLRERFAVSTTLRIRGIGETEQYTLEIDSDPWRIEINPVLGSGAIMPTLKLLSSDASLLEIAATIVSQTGSHSRIDAIGIEKSLPVGKYRLENVRVEVQDDRRWSIAFEQFNESAPFSIEVRADELTETDLIGKLTLSASILGGGMGAGNLTVNPSLKTQTGLTIVKSSVGKLHATQDNQLTASLVQFSKQPSSDSLDAKTPDNLKDAVDRKGTGFACGSFCPINLSARGRLLPGMMVALQFDAGPLGGPMLELTSVKLPSSDVDDSAQDLLDFPDEE